MRISRTAAAAAFLALTAWVPTTARKEFVRLQLSTVSGAPVRVRLSTRGLLIIAPHPTVARPPAAVDTTFTTPAELTLAGVGEADLESVDARTDLVVSVTQIRRNAPPAVRLTGRSFRVSHATYSEAYGVTTVPR